VTIGLFGKLNMTDLSICIPTYNRTRHLENSLNSIFIASKKSNLEIEVCVSDNCSEENTFAVIKKYNEKIRIVFNQNKKNIGYGKNSLKSVSMAKGEFVWMLGNDDLILPDTFNVFQNLIYKNPEVDFFYVNSYHLNLEILDKSKFPFDTSKFDFSKLKRFSNYKKSEKQKFFQLINPFKSFEFMLSTYLCIYRRKFWLKHTKEIDKKNIVDTRLYSNFDNTAPHIKIWSVAFKNKTAYFFHEPLTANVHGPRGEDWGNLYAFVEAVRIPEVLDCYRNNGMSFLRFFLCKNFALRRFFPSFYSILLKPGHSGLEFVKIREHVIKNLLYPGIYLFGLYFFIRRFFIIVINFFNDKHKVFFS